jgi:hypothetical protein
VTKPASFFVSGSGFTPFSYVTLVVGHQQPQVSTTVRADAMGNLTATLSRVSSTSLSPHMDTISAYSYGQAPSPPLATRAVPSIARGVDVNHLFLGPYFPVAASRSFQVGGYPNATVYAHYFLRPFGRLFPRFIKTVPIGRTTGSCGALASKFYLFNHVGLQEGGWTVVVNRYKSHAVIPATGMCVGVVRWPGDGRSPFPNDPHPDYYLISGLC